MKNSINKAEQEHLDIILKELHLVRDILDHFLNDQDDKITTAKNNLWENNRDLDHAEKAMVRMDIDQSIVNAESHASHLQRLDKLCNAPYFGRIDFKEENKNIQDLYIGIHSFTDADSNKVLINDWRSPISSMFYDFELGSAHYTAPKGTVYGKINLKRQFQISNGHLDFVIESSISIHDEVLQKTLSNSSDDKMRNIVSTIQRDQNSIIRNDSSQTLVIQGVAGSGKSSIALHRIAFLLYHQKESLTAKDMLIISPNKVFSDYISNVLPELGEENVPEVEINELAYKLIGKKVKHESFLRQVGRLAEKSEPEYSERIRFKSNNDFITKLNQYTRYIISNQFKTVNLEVGPYLIPKDFIQKCFNDLPSIKFSLAQRISRVINAVINFDQRIKFTKFQEEDISKQIKAMLTVKTTTQYYKEFYQWIEMPEMYKAAAGRILEYADLFPLAFLTMRLKGYEKYSKVKHLLVDEMQDYTPLQYHIINMLFNCPKTILGDATQNINPYSSTTHEAIQAVFENSDLVKLCKSYRSSYEITQLAQKIIKDNDLVAIERHGPTPKLIEVKSNAAQLVEIKKLIHEFENCDYHALAIICKTQKQMTSLYKTLSEEFEINMMDEGASNFHAGISITTAYLAKGLEFDQVIVPFADKNTYSDKISQGLLYVACTRAMHRLDLISLGDNWFK